MTLTPEPRPARRPFARDRLWPTRAETEALEAKLAALNEYDPRPSIFGLRFEPWQLRYAAIVPGGIRMIDYIIYRSVPRQRRRLLRKQLRLAAHRQKKLDRIPTWKRTANPKGTR